MTTPDLKVIATYLKDNMKSVKGFYVTWNKQNQMGITLPFKFKPTIAKFDQVGEVEFYIDFSSGELSYNTYSPRYHNFPGSPSKKIGNFTDAKQLLTLIKKHFAAGKKEEIEKFNNGPANRWAR
jgi:hypothetical protein